MKMRIERSLSLVLLISGAVMGCSKSSARGSNTPAATQVPTYFKVDPSTAGSVSGLISYSGPRLRSNPVDMSSDPACVSANHGKVYDDSMVVGPHNGVGDAFIYISKGLEGKTFPPLSAPVTIDQKGCWFRPHILGLQTGQSLQIVNSDPVTHNIHPMPEMNREWNHTQGSGDPPMNHTFTKAEVMIPIKCNIHGWMHAYVGVVDHPYFAVSDESGRFAIPNLPPGDYTLTAWTQKLGIQQQAIKIGVGGSASSNFTFHAK